MVSLSELSTGARLEADFFARDVGEVAPALIGCRLLVDGVGGTIVEVERYQDDDPASHSFTGPRGRAAVMFGEPGTIYVYRSYGIHWCMNLVCDAVGRGAAVLLRAIAPTVRIERMRGRRPGISDRLLCAGPGRLTAALGVDEALNASSAVARHGRVEIIDQDEAPEIVCGPRVGISRATEKPWRFGLADSPFLSKRFPAQ